MASPDSLYEDLSGPAMAHLMQRQYYLYGDKHPDDSYSSSLFEHFLFPPVRQRTEGKHVNLYPKKFSQFCANSADIEEGGFFRGVDEDVQIAFI